MLRATIFALSCALALGQDVMLYIENLAKPDLGVYWGGAADLERPLEARDYYYEKLVDTVPKEHFVSHETYVGHAFIIRSADFRIRIRVIVEQGQSAQRPFKLTFINLSADDEDPQVELKHSSSGYVWIEGTEHVSHDTALHHPFDIRDNRRVPIMRFILRPLGKTEL